MLQEKFKFELPSSFNASVPPERRGIRRDFVKMMVQRREDGATIHDSFINLDRHLKKGDALVLNSSRTLPATFKAELYRKDEEIAREVEIRLARRVNDFTWEALVIYEALQIGDELIISSELQGQILHVPISNPFVTIQFSKEGSSLYGCFYTLGEPVRYEYINKPLELDYYQTVFASHPGSVEMPSAGRAFSWELLFKLQKKGIKLIFIQLHTGLSYLLDDKWDHSPTENREEYHIPVEAWEQISQTKQDGGRIVAVGTTVVRALESAAMNGCLSGWTNLYVQASHNLKIANGIITGLHEPEASHLDMLTAFIQHPLLFKAYHEAIERKYLWHEFGDMNLIL